MLDFTQIEQANAVEITELLDAVLLRYQALFPEWEISTVSVEKVGDRNEQIDRIIRSLQNMRD